MTFANLRGTLNEFAQRIFGEDRRIRTSTRTYGGGTLTISPDTGQVGTWGTWVATFAVGASGIARGGGIRVALPHRWQQWYRNSARPLQTWDPTDAFYVTAHTDSEGVELACEIPNASPEEFPKGADKLTIDSFHQKTRFCWTVCVTVEHGALSEGDTVSVLYGDTSHGGRGFTPPQFAGSAELVRAEVDSTGAGDFEPLPDESLPMLAHTPGPAVDLLMVLPSVSVVGEEAILRMVALDQYQNGVPLPDTVVNLVVDEGDAELGATQVNLGGRETLGAATLTCRPSTAGPLRVRGTSADGALYGRSNACNVVVEPPAERVYWGDLHAHTHWSGTGDDHFRYAKYAALLDVFSASDYSQWISLRHELWPNNVRDSELWHEDGRFVTLFGSEASYGWPFGHPLSFGIVDLTFQGPQDPGSHLHNSWLMGLKLGVIASSNNTMAQPGKDGYGTMAVWSSSLTRAAVFEAIRQRRTYGSTGSRIYVEFFVNGQPMGGEIALASGESANVRVKVLGTGPLRWIEVLRADLDRPEERFTVVHREWYPGAAGVRNAELQWTDPSPPRDGLYYVRTRQRDIVNGRVAEAWTSPVWVEVGPG